MIFSSPAPPFGQWYMSMSKVRLSRCAQLKRCGRTWTVSTSISAAATAAVAGFSGFGGPGGPTRARSFTFGASTPWSLMRCNLGRGTSAASPCMNSSVLITRCVVLSPDANSPVDCWCLAKNRATGPGRPEGLSRHGVFNSSSTWPAAFSCTRL